MSSDLTTNNPEIQGILTTDQYVKIAQHLVQDIIDQDAFDIVDNPLSLGQEQAVNHYIQNSIIPWKDLQLDKIGWSGIIAHKQEDQDDEDAFHYHVRLSQDAQWYAMVSLDPINDLMEEVISVGQVDGPEHILCMWSGCHPQWSIPDLSWCYSHGNGFGISTENWDQDLATGAWDFQTRIQSWLENFLDWNKGRRESNK